MNESNRNKLEDEIQSQLEALKDTPTDSDEYRTIIEGLTKLMDRSIKEKELEQNAELKRNELTTESQLKRDQINSEAQLKRDQMINEAQLKREQMRKEDIRGWVGLGLTGLGTLATIGLTVWGTKKTIDFEQNGIQTTTAGREFFRRLFARKN